MRPSTLACEGNRRSRLRGRADPQRRVKCGRDIPPAAVACRRPLSLGIVAGCLLLLIAIAPANFTIHAADNSDGSVLLYTTAKGYDSLAWMHGADRFTSDAAIFVRDQKGQHRLVPAFAASADAAVSFDGHSVLFAGKAHAGDPWQIWEVALTGRRPPTPHLGLRRLHPSVLSAGWSNRVRAENRGPLCYRVRRSRRSKTAGADVQSSELSPNRHSA